MMHRAFHWFTGCWHYTGEQVLRKSHTLNREPTLVAHSEKAGMRCCRCNALSCACYPCSA